MENPELTVKAIFDHAHEMRSPTQRRAYLDQACAGAPELRQRVEALLQSYEEAGSFLEQPALDPAATGPHVPAPTGPPEAASPPQTGDLDPARRALVERQLTEGPGSRIGPYKLLQRLDEGGMGVVYLAEQDQPVRRRVALKIIKPGMDTGQVVARFEAERQALALMDHANIARVYDAGSTDSGRPFFVMELVKGVRITTYCDENRLSPRERLALFVPVCQAIQHAHQKGIIHRDIKPHNVLVTMYDGKPVPKVIDFGIAKAIEQRLTEKTLFTALGQVIGTLEYMSPEQAEANALDIDTRSDIYSLGVLLYELLTGTTPLDRKRLRHAAFTEMLRMIREDEPAKPSTRLSESGERLPGISAQRRSDPTHLTKLVRGELDWIVMKALEKDRTRRYESATGFARDIERYLADEPVEACPPSRGYLLRKFARKNRRLLTVTGAFVALLLVGVVGLSIGIVAVQKARKEAEVALEQKTEAEAHTRKTLGFARNEVIEELMQRNTELNQKQREFLGSLLQQYREFAERQGDSEVAAEGHFSVARILHLMRDEQAEPGYRHAITYLQQLIAGSPNRSVYRHYLAEASFNLGHLLNDAARQKEAADVYVQAIRLWEGLIQEGDKDSHKLRRDLASAYNNRGAVLFELDQLDEADQAYSQALDIDRQRLLLDPANLEARIDLAGTYHNRGNVLLKQAKPEAALPHYNEAIAHLSGLPEAARQLPEARVFLRDTYWDRAVAKGALAARPPAAERARWRDETQQDWREALTQAERVLELEGRGGQLGEDLYYAARAHALASVAFDDQPAQQREYADKAMHLLSRAENAKYFRAPAHRDDLRTQSDLNALRTRADFKTFLSKLGR